MKKRLDLGLYPILVLICIVYIIICFTGKEMPNEKSLFFCEVMLGIVAAVSLGIAYFCGERKLAIEKSFIFLIVTFGLVYFVTVPLFGVPDEINHYKRCFEISEGNMISEHIGESGIGGNYLPEGLIPDALSDKENIDYYNVLSSLNNKIDYNEKCEYRFGNTALYAPFVYLPQTIGIFFARLITDRTVYIAYAGRMTTFLFFAICCYFAIKNLKFGKLPYLAIILMPRTLSGAVSMSADTVTNAVVLLFVSYIVKYCYDTSLKEISKRDMSILAILTIELSLCKIVYIPICLLVFLLPSKLFKNKRIANGYKIVLVIVAIFVNLIWLAISAGFLVEFNSGVDSKAQVIFVLTHMIKYIVIALETGIRGSWRWLAGMIGSYSGADMSLVLPVWSVIIYVILLGMTMLMEKDRESINYKDNKIVKVSAGIVIFAVIALTLTSLYVQWTPVASSLILGVQGRYFIPLLPLVMVVLKDFSFKRIKEIDRKYLYMTIVFVNMIVIIKQTSFYL